jgi:hypothetical protein
MFDFETGDTFAQPGFLLYGGGPGDQKKKKRVLHVKELEKRIQFGQPVVPTVTERSHLAVNSDEY